MLLAGAILTGTFHLDEMVRLPVELSHYAAHRSASNEVNFLRFLASHSLPGNNQDDGIDGMNHARLPYKSAKSLLDHFSAPLLPMGPGELIAYSVPQLIFIRESGLVMTKYIDIFHPPKV